MAENIEREALLHDIEQSVIYTARGKITSAEMRGAHKIIERIKCAPAVDVAPVVHGQWIDKPTGRYGQMQSWCSACGKHSGIGGIKSNRHKPYCPNCGAKMDGGEGK